MKKRRKVKRLQPLRVIFSLLLRYDIYEIRGVVYYGKDRKKEEKFR